MPPPGRRQVFADVEHLAALHPRSRVLAAIQQRSEMLRQAKFPPLPGAAVGAVNTAFDLPLAAPDFAAREQRLARAAASTEQSVAGSPPERGLSSQQTAERQALERALAERYVSAWARIGPAWREAARQDAENDMGPTVSLLSRLAATGLSESERQATLATLEAMRAERSRRARDLRMQLGSKAMRDWAEATLALMQWQPREEQETQAASRPPLPAAEEDLAPAREALAAWRSAWPGDAVGLAVTVPRVEKKSGGTAFGGAAGSATQAALRDLYQAEMLAILIDTATAALQAAQSRGWDLSIQKREGRDDVTEVIKDEVAQRLAQEAG